MSREPVRVEDIARITFVSNPSISPDGDIVAYVAGRADLEGNSYRYTLWLAGEEGFKPLTGGPLDRCPSWSPDGRLLAFVRAEPQGRGAGIYIVGREGGEPWRLYWSRWGVSRIQWSPTGEMVAFTARRPLDESGWKPYMERTKLEINRIPVRADGEGWVFDRFVNLYAVSYPGGSETPIVVGDKNVVDFDWHPSGAMIAYAVSEEPLEPYKHKVYVHDLESGSRRMVAKDLTVASLRWSPQGNRLALKAHRRERGFTTHFKVYILDPEDGSMECQTCDLDRNASNAVNSDVRGPSCLKGLEWTREGIYFQVSDAGRIHLYRVVEGGEPEPVIAPERAVVDEFSATRDGTVIAATLMTPTSPLEVHLYRNRELVKITSHNEWLSRERVLAEPVHHEVESPHGGKIDFWILPPARRPECKKCVPWILYIHGGPKTSYGYSFIHEFHALSASGFAVVYSNPRGSDGYSEDFADQRGRYAEVDFDELMRIADEIGYLDPSIDPDRAGVTGGSYGGYMTNMIVSKTRRFKAALTQRSCSNWFSFYGESDIGWYFAPDILSTKTPWEAPGDYIERSPLFKANEIETPLLILHALEDYRCPASEAIQLFTALKVLGKEVKLVMFPGENHDLSRSGRPRQRIERLKTIISWFKDKLG